MTAAKRARKRLSKTDTSVAARLLDWYDLSRRDLPWRYAPGTQVDPYRVWLSEIMLQQTTVKAVIPYFGTFTTRWPTVEALAMAPLDEVLAAWAGLGYYARARNLHACAKAVAHEHAGRFPANEAALLDLPGVGPYTAAAIAAIGHGLTATPVDGNIERVVARLFAVEESLPSAKPTLRRHAQALTPNQRAGDFAQAMMDLGATVCTPKSPSCLVCPIADPCQARAQGIAADLPRKAAKAERPTRYGVAFVVERTDGAVLLRRRPPEGLLGGMLEVPSTEWTGIPPAAGAVYAAMPIKIEFKHLPGAVMHVFTHFRLELTVHRVRLRRGARLATIESPWLWLPTDRLDGEALPSVMRKVLAHAGIGGEPKRR